MPPTILSSPLMSLTMLDKFLSNPNLSPAERIPLLHAKITLLSNDAASLGSSPRPAPGAGTSSVAQNGPDDRMKTMFAEMEARIQVADLCMASQPLRVVEAENELTMVEGRLKGYFKPRRREDEPGGDGQGGAEVVGQRDMERIREMRVKSLERLVGVEEALGREGRAKRWRELVEKLRLEGAGS